MHVDDKIAKEDKPVRLYSAAQVRTGERQIAQRLGLEMYTLMERAGAAVFDCLARHYPSSRNVLVCCGGGNNGGDGYVVARLARQAGYTVSVWHCGDPARLVGDAARAYQAWLAVGGVVSLPSEGLPASVEVVVDALLGTGLAGAVRAEAAALIGQINDSARPVIAVDVPSGLCADTGRGLVSAEPSVPDPNVTEPAVVAAYTVTFIGRKQGLFTGHAADHVGQLVFAGLEVAAAFDQHCTSSVQVITAAEVDRNLPIRRRTAHKGDHGRILLAGGDHGYAGAIRLAAQAAARTGAGLTAVLTQSDNALAMIAAIPEIMALGWQGDRAQCAQRVVWADVLVLGPGLGLSEWSQALYHALAATEKPTVLDADGLNLLACTPDYKNNRIITPHPGEAARLLQCSVADVERDRFVAARTLQQQYGGVVVLKGVGTLVDDGQKCWVCTAGNPGMATGGMGDVLSGIIGALLGQGLGLSEAAKCGVWIHSTAADHCARDGERGMLASDLFPSIRQLVNRR
ncbi:NAD(P)H-hydrate dehydratase [Photobacterium japonica]|uniref:NAD(P)H-hydrate dehydratase n=1 Tax=Photobacterium japonica TaxID=2910235 RepID=UPI003D0D79D5